MKSLELFAQRRTIYDLSDRVTQSKEELQKIIMDAVNLAPSAFNSQSSRVVILFGKEQDYLWNTITMETLKAIVPAEHFAPTQAKIESFAKAYGTVLFYEDSHVVKHLQEQFPTYADNFPVWSEHSTAIAQYATWVALSEAGLGANLQHYNPIIDEKVAKHWNLPDHWVLRAELNFGHIETAAGPKETIPAEKRFRIFG